MIELSESSNLLEQDPYKYSLQDVEEPKDKAPRQQQQALGGHQALIEGVHHDSLSTI